MPTQTTYTLSQLRTPLTVAQNKANLYADLMDPDIVGTGLQNPLSWADGSVPSSLVEVEANGLTEFQWAAKAVVEGGYNELATGDALQEHSRQVYQNEPLAGKFAIGKYRLYDTAGAGPFTFDVRSFSASIGKGGLIYDGIADPNTLQTKYTLPLNGYVDFFIQCRETGGGAHNAAPGTIDTLVRGVLPGATGSNLAGWQTWQGAQQGADDESVASLRTRNRTKWQTLGVGSPPPAYENWVRGADASITRVEVFTNLDTLDPGSVTVVIAGDGGALPGDVVTAAQQAVAPKQVGGTRIPACARAIVASAANNTIPVSGILYVDASFNDPTLLDQIQANVDTFAAALKIGALVSWERLHEAILYVAGLDPGLIFDATGLLPQTDTSQRFNQVASFDLSGLQLISK